MSKIVKYSNNINNINFSKFSKLEQDIIFIILFLAQKKSILNINFIELNRLLSKRIKKERLKAILYHINSKIEFLKKDNIKIFSAFHIDVASENIFIVVDSSLYVELNFTKFDLIDFIKLKSTYSKNIFKILKQWENIGIKEFTIEEFRKILAIPESYRMSIIDIKVLKPITTELQMCFCDLKIEKLKTGREITGIKFSWKKKKENNIIQDIIEINISEDLSKAIEKAKQNRYIKKLLDIDNIEILTEMFGEKELIKGLNYAYKEINQEIKTLNYLIKTIKTGIEYKEKKIVVKSENKEAKEIKETGEGNKSDEIKNITEEEYKELYQKYLKENGIVDTKFLRQCFERSIQGKYKIKDRKK